MAQQVITIGTADAGGGETPFSAFTKVNANFTELYSQSFAGSNIQVITAQEDYPTQDDTTITLEDNIAYWVASPYTQTKQFVGGNAAMMGNAAAL